MPRLNRRTFLSLSATATGAALLAACSDDAMADATPTPAPGLHKIEHVVILLQENRSFDHYLGTMRGMRGFGDRFGIPVATGPTVFHQRFGAQTVVPFHLDPAAGNALRVGGTPHSFLDAHAAWNEGRMNAWPDAKTALSMGYYDEAELAFQRALSETFTTCDAYHCGFQGGTLPNRFIAFTGTLDPLGKDGGPAVDNSHETLGPVDAGYRWKTYAERLEAAGVSWKVYQDFADVFGDNPLVAFATFRAAHETDPSSPLVDKGLGSPLSGADLTGLRNDVIAGALPSVSWIVAPGRYSEHPGPSSPTQGAYYVQEVLSALQANPDVFAKTVLLVTFDENDGFFDHVPPPCAPSLDGDDALIGGSTIDTTTERSPSLGWTYGPGPRVPLWVISAFSRGGWVCSETFDHTSIIRLLEQRFGVAEPNISAYRRAMMGDLTSCFDFSSPDRSPPALPMVTREQADALIAAQETKPKVSAPPSAGPLPVQPLGPRPSRALPYALSVDTAIDDANGKIALTFTNAGAAGAVFHVYDRTNLAAVPRRYAVEARKTYLDAVAATDAYDLWLLGPNGFHRTMQGAVGVGSAHSGAEVTLSYDSAGDAVVVRCTNAGGGPRAFRIEALAYDTTPPVTVTVAPGQRVDTRLSVAASGRWYDLSVTLVGVDGFARRFAGRMENGRPSTSDPAMGS